MSEVTFLEKSVRVSPGQTKESTPPTPPPRQFTLTQVHVPGYQLLSPVDLLVESDEEGVTVYDEWLDLNGEGSTLLQALLDYEEALVEFYEDLTKAGEHLAPHLKEKYRLLAGILSPQTQDASSEA